MKNLKIFVILLLSFVMVAGAITITEKLIITHTTSFTADETKILTVTEGGTAVPISGDSVGFNVNFSTDSIQGYITYNWTTKDGSLSPTTNTLTLSDGSSSFSLGSGETSVFTNAISRVAGVYRIYLYLNLTNNNYNTVTLVTKTYKVVSN